MLDFERMVRAGVEFAGTSRVTLAATYDLSEQVCRDFADRSLIAGYVANGASPQAPAVSLVTGHWTDRANGRWQLRSAGVSVLVFLGSTLDLGGRMLLAAQLAGVRRIVVVHFDGSISADINVPRALVGRLKHALVSRLLAGGIDSKLTPLTWIADQSFEKAYELLYTLFTGRLRMARDEFVPRRLLIIAGSLGPGGAERQVAYTAAAIMKSGQYEVYVGCNFLEPPSDFFRSQLEAAGVKVLSVPADAPEYRTPELTALRKQFARGDALGLQNIAYAMFHYALLIRAVRPTVVHTWMDYCNVLGGIAADIVGVPALVLGGRSLAPDHFAIFQPYMRPGYRLLLEKRPIVFLNNSRAGAHDYGRWLDVPADTFGVIPNGFAFPDGQSPEMRTDERKRLGLSNDAFVVGSIIRFSEEKRPRLILDMARVLARRYPQLQFVIFGTGPLLEDMRSCVRKWGLSDVIRLPGLTTDAWASLRALDVFVLASRMEGLPNVVIEAQASGVPVVCTAVGGTPETFVDGQTGFGVASSNPEDLAQAVSRLVDDRDLHRTMSQKAYEHARATFDIDRMTAATLQAYADAQAGPSAPRDEPEVSRSAKEAPELRFEFGKNWHRFVRRNFSEQRSETAKDHLLRFLDRTALDGLEFLDIGCGSGLHSLAAYRSGAGRIHSFDYDPHSVATTRLVRTMAGEPAAWTVERGDILDPQYVGRLGRWNLVYSWGVLHHTGDVWQALRNAQSLVADGGRFYIALYSADVETPEQQKFWLCVKQDYNRSGRWGRLQWEWWYIWTYYMERSAWKFPAFLRRVARHRLERGMSLFADLRDWLGGWPMEYVHDQDVVDLLEQECGFKLLNAATGQACSEFLFERSGRPAARTIVADMVVRRKVLAQEAALASAACDTLVLEPPFHFESGHLYKAFVPQLAAISDSIKQPDASPVRLREDGNAVGIAHAVHSEILNLGHGRYSHWGDTLYFSSSDNSDPNKNGRQYSLVYPSR